MAGEAMRTAAAGKPEAVAVRMADQAIYWVEAPLAGRLAVVARPRSQAHVTALKAAGIDLLVSLLEPEEAADVGLGDEAGLCAEAGIEFFALPVTDHGIPTSFEAVEAAVALIARQLAAGRGVGAHCYAGLGRSPLLVACVLIHHGHSDDEAVALVSAARGWLVPEMDSQHAWLMRYHARHQGRART